MPSIAKPLPIAAALIASLVIPAAHGVKPQRWQHTNEADFEPGVAEGVVVTNLGDIKLAREVEALAEMPETVTVVHDAAMLGDTVYLAVGPEPAVMAYADGELTEFATVDGGQAFALGTHDGQLLVGVSGEPAQLLTLDAQGEAASTVDLPEDVRYVWDVVSLPGDGGLILATGPSGQLLRVTADGEAETLYDATQANLLSLAASPTASGFPMYAGTDTDGLVYRFASADEPPYVVYDAAEPEVAAIVVADDGQVYFGTADAEQARPGRLEQPADAEAGRPTAAAAGDAPAPDDAPPSPDDLPRVPPA
ncbi:MAG: hypothetical protein AAGK09_11140, partial [Planctomycetota bacterium]